jgi:hypothetical protein
MPRYKIVTIRSEDEPPAYWVYIGLNYRDGFRWVNHRIATADHPHRLDKFLHANDVVERAITREDVFVGPSERYDPNDGVVSFI